MEWSLRRRPWGGTKFTITCTALAEGGEKLDPIFETCMKTFRFDAN